MDAELRRSAPLLDAYLKYLELGSTRTATPFMIPGHKNRAHLLDAGLGRAVDSDVPLFGGLDEIKVTKGVLARAEALAATLWGGDWARFSTGGSTHGCQALIFAIAKPGAKVAITRTAHRSLLSALVLAGLEPLWLTPEFDTNSGIPMGISTQALARALSEDPVAVILTEPGYLGSISDLPTLVALAHSRNIPVIVDQAWGAHFGFHPELPKHALQLGADAFVTSIHKTLPGYSASALVIAKNERISATRLEQAFEVTHTTSPAGAPLASIDGTRALLAIRGYELLDRLIMNVNRLRADLADHLGFDILVDPKNFAPGRFDPVKLILQTQLIGADGIELEKLLIERGVRVEMADHDTLILLATLADDEKTFNVLIRALKEVLIVGTPRLTETALSWRITPTTGVGLREAFFAQSELMPAKQAIGRISADLIAPYPPGVAVVAPGEFLTEAVVTGLQATQAQGVRIAYSTDPTLKEFRVLALP